MLLKLIKTRPMMSGSHCEIWEINHLWGDRLLGEVFVLNEHLPLELIYRLTVTVRGICIQGRSCGWMWESDGEQYLITYLQQIQQIKEEIYLEVSAPEPDLPGYPQTDYNPDDYPIVFVD